MASPDALDPAGCRAHARAGRGRSAAPAAVAPVPARPGRQPPRNRRLRDDPGARAVEGDGRHGSGWLRPGHLRQLARPDPGMVARDAVRADRSAAGDEEDLRQAVEQSLLHSSEVASASCSITRAASWPKPKPTPTPIAVGRLQHEVARSPGQAPRARPTKGNNHRLDQPTNRASRGRRNYNWRNRLTSIQLTSNW